MALRGPGQQRPGQEGGGHGRGDWAALLLPHWNLTQSPGQRQCWSGDLGSRGHGQLPGCPACLDAALPLRDLLRQFIFLSPLLRKPRCREARPLAQVTPPPPEAEVDHECRAGWVQRRVLRGDTMQPALGPWSQGHRRRQAMPSTTVAILVSAACERGT